MRLFVLAPAAGTARTVQMSGHDAVAGAKEGRDAGQLAGQPEGPHPPDMPGDLEDGIRAAPGASVGEQKAHFHQDGLPAQTESFARAGGLKGDKLEAVRPKHGSQASR